MDIAATNMNDINGAHQMKLVDLVSTGIKSGVISMTGATFVQPAVHAGVLTTPRLPRP